MPVGSLSVYPEIIRLTLLNNPKKVLDVGIGYGMNGAGIRNWFNDAVDRQIVLHGIEPFSDYDNPLWECYDMIQTCTLLDYEIREKYDVIICTDVCEHWPKDEIEDNINKLKLLLEPNGVILMSTPAIWIEQGAYKGNDLETHHVLWGREMFERYGFNVIRDLSYNDPYGHRMLIAEYLNR